MKTETPGTRHTPVFSRLLTFLQAVIVLFAIAVSAADANAAPSAYVVALTPNGPQFGSIDLASGHFAPIGPTPVTLANLVWWKGTLLSLSTSDPYAGYLIQIDPANGKVTPIGSTGLGYNAFDLAEVGGKLYLTDFSNNIYSVDPESGAATLMAATGMPPDPNIPFTTNNDGTFNLCDESLYGVGGSLYATFDSFNIDPATLMIDEYPGDSTVSPALYRIDPATGAATLIGPTNLGLGATVEVGGRFYAFKGIATGFVSGFPQGFMQLVSLDRSTGKATFIRNIDASAGIVFGAAPVANVP
jgi:hypothetical protein